MCPSGTCRKLVLNGMMLALTRESWDFLSFPFFPGHLPTLKHLNRIMAQAWMCVNRGQQAGCSIPDPELNNKMKKKKKTKRKDYILIFGTLKTIFF